MALLHLCLLALVSVAFASGPPPPEPYQPYQPQPYSPPHPAPQPRPSYGKPPPSYEEPTEPPVYNYGYAVNDDYEGVYFQANENRDGYNTAGSYVVNLPDGRKQTVTYEDNGDGLIANVIYEGEAQYPVEDYKPKPKYPPQPPPKYAPQPSYPAFRRR